MTGTPSKDRAEGWRYDICYGPEGEANYAFVSDAQGAHVGNLRIHYAKAIVDAMNNRATAFAEGMKRAAEIAMDQAGIIGAARGSSIYSALDLAHEAILSEAERR